MRINLTQVHMCMIHPFLAQETFSTDAQIGSEVPFVNVDIENFIFFHFYFHLFLCKKIIIMPAVLSFVIFIKMIFKYSKGACAREMKYTTKRRYNQQGIGFRYTWGRHNFDMLITTI